MAGERKTINERVDEAIAANIALGYMIEVEPGKYRLTELGKNYADLLGAANSGGGGA